jgi:hypothetical protein
MADLLERPTAALADRYAIERELGGEVSRRAGTDRRYSNGQVSYWGVL